MICRTCQGSEHFPAKDTKDFPNITDSRFAIYMALLAMPGLKHEHLPLKKFVNCSQVYDKKLLRSF